MAPADDRPRGRLGRANRGLGLLTLLVVLIAAAGAMLARFAPPTAPARPAPPANGAPYDLRLSGSPVIGEALAPALVEAWLVSRGADEVDVAQLRSGATVLPERVVSARLGEHKTRVDIRAGGDGPGLADLAAGRADIALIARPLKAKQPASETGRGVEIGETRSTGAGPPIQRLALYTARTASPQARAFTAFATSDAGQAIVHSAGLLPTADPASPAGQRRP